MIRLNRSLTIRRPPRRPGATRRSSAPLLAAATAIAALSWTITTPGTAAAVCSSIPSTADPQATLAVYGVGRELGVSSKVMLAGFEAGWVESHMNNLTCGDRDSLGVFQQRPSQGWGTPSQVRNVRYASRAFLTRAQVEERACGGCTAGEIAQRVQRPDPGLRSRYDESESQARSLLDKARPRYAGRYSIHDVCGPGFRYLDGHELTGGTVYLLWNGTSNCVTTIKTSSIGTRTPVKAYVDPQGPSYRADTGPYAYYAGPSTLPAPGCIRWGGAVGASPYDSELEHCG